MLSCSNIFTFQFKNIFYFSNTICNTNRLFIFAFVNVFIFKPTISVFQLIIKMPICTIVASQSKSPYIKKLYLSLNICNIYYGNKHIFVFIVSNRFISIINMFRCFINKNIEFFHYRI